MDRATTTTHSDTLAGLCLGAASDGGRLASEGGGRCGAARGRDDHRQRAHDGPGAAQPAGDGRAVAVGRSAHSFAQSGGVRGRCGPQGPARARLRRGPRGVRRGAPASSDHLSRRGGIRHGRLGGETSADEEGILRATAPAGIGFQPTATPCPDSRSQGCEGAPHARWRERVAVQEHLAL